MKKLGLIWVGIGLFSLSGCSLFKQRSEEFVQEDFRKQNVALSSPLERVNLPPQRIKQTPSMEDSYFLFDDAFALQKEAAFKQASEKWLDFLNQFPSHPGSREARYNLALCYFQLGETKQATALLKQLLEEKATPLQTEVRLLLAECLIDEEKYEEALSLSYEILGDENKSEAAMISALRQSSPQKPKTSSEIQTKTYLLRARLYAVLKKTGLAKQSLQNAENSLNTLKTKGFSPETRRLTALYSWRKLEGIEQNCQQINPIPVSLSEDTILSYVDHHYRCVALAPEFYCATHTHGDEAITASALQVLKTLAWYPLRIKAELKKLSAAKGSSKRIAQNRFFEKEMSEWIDKKVAEESERFRNIESCKATNLF